MADFGYKEIGDDTDYFYLDRIYGTEFTSPADAATAISISVYGQGWGSSPNLKAVICDAAEEILTNGVGAPVVITENSLNWYTSSFVTPPTLSPSTNYILCVIADGTVQYKRHGGSTDQTLYDASNSYASPTDPSDAARYDLELSIYCTYGAVGVGVMAGHYYRKLMQGDGYGC